MADLAFRAWAQSAMGAASTAIDDGARELRDEGVTPSVLLHRPTGEPRRVTRSAAVRMLGPGGVALLDPRFVTRVHPAPGVPDARSNDMAMLELSVPELPWLFTPAQPGPTPEQSPAASRLRPWIVLVVVDAGTPFDSAARPLPLLHASSAELPDLAQSWAWAHVQSPPGVAGGIARLLCPRRLDGKRRYRACLVPAFAGGREAAMGSRAPHTDSLAPAWDIEPLRDVTLPVFHTWEFGTGLEGDFEDLVRRLRPAGQIPGLGARDVDLSHPWPDASPLDEADGPARLSVRGAMHALADPDVDTLPLAAVVDFQTRLTAELAAPANRLVPQTPDGEDKAPAADETAAVAPPLYGGRHTGVDHIHPGFETSLQDLGWIEELNLDPAHRIAAGLGAEYVRINQEDLMARAWEQVGAIREANRRRAMAELADGLAQSVHRRHVEPLGPGELVLFASPAARRIRTAKAALAHDVDPTLAHEVFASPLADTAATPAFARLMRPAGPVARRAETDSRSVLVRGLRGEVTTPEPNPLMSAFGEPGGQPPPSPLEAVRLVLRVDMMRLVAQANGLDAGASAIANQLATLSGLDPTAMAAGDEGALEAALAPDTSAVQVAIAEIGRALAAASPEGERRVTAAGVEIDPQDLGRRLRDALVPGDRIAVRLATRVTGPSTLIGQPGFAPVRAYPGFGLPMALALRDMAPDWFLPGAGAVPAERVALLAPNVRFIESFLAGLNQEMMAELLWREYPTDRRGSPFRVFWPRPGGTPDVPGLDEWDPSTPLGSHSELRGDGMSIVLVRGELVRRFPEMIVAAVRAQPTDRLGPDTTERSPLTPSVAPEDAHPSMFSFPIDDGTRAYALPVAPDELLSGQPGWFIVFQEHDYRMRFGFDVADPAAGTDRPLGSWNDLDWNHVDPLVAPGRRGFANAALNLAPSGGDEGMRWGPAADATHVARITLQKPFRVAMQSTRLLT
jgi:hypothetical protein